jgi:NAD(P)-dependent dehydrogenase (short-subunit alcohol dehydrogenase family)
LKDELLLYLEGKLFPCIKRFILTSDKRASGLGQACVEDICRRGGYAAVLDMNEELAQELVKEVGGDKTKFFQCNVLETESIEAAVKGTLDWVKETGKEVGGVIAAAGVSTPAKVCYLPCAFLFSHVS